MNAIPVINPATVTDVFQAGATDPLSMKKKTVAANIPIEITQKVIPTKSSEARRTVSAFAAPEKPKKATVAKANNLSLFIKNSLIIVFFSLNLNYSSIRNKAKVRA
tara:strand:- start:381 stop:698 length:318 start_codon:yes stop_codon:yes gene_type:complete